jgi:hypothetical protein
VKYFLFVLAFCASSHASTVLFVGDSHTTGPFGKKLDELIRAQHSVMTRGACGTIGQNWELGTSTTCAKWNWGRDIDGKEIISPETPKLEALIETINPEYVILQFGGNYRSKLKDDQFSIPEDVSRLIKTAKKLGAKCLFVTGPDTYVMRSLLPDTVDQIQQGVGQDCAFFNSLEVTQYPDEYVGKRRPDGKKYTDGKHYSFLPAGEPLAHAWAEKVFMSFTELQQSISLSSEADELHSQE